MLYFVGMKLIDLTDRVFSRLTVLSREGRIGVKVAWRCKCSCGTQVLVRGTDLTMNKSRSCGCLQREQVGSINRSHEQTGTPTYNTWCNMIQRCTNENLASWPDYGGRGITICDRWLKSFECFLEDMGEKPANRSIDRINNSEGYSPENCRWATASQQQKNRRPDKVPRLRDKLGRWA